MKIAYLDCTSGISGDMTLGALVDAGADLAQIQRGIDSLGLPDCRLRAEQVQRRGFRALKIHVEFTPEHVHRHLHHITEMIDGSRLSVRQKRLASRIFTRLAEAEARVHGTTIEKVHFHEVGAVDSIADIVGAAIGFDLLGIGELVCSPIPPGSGHVTIAHGRVAVPAPATAELLKGVPLAESPVSAELTTPTGAALAATLANQFGPLPAFTIESIGYGAGSRDFPDHSNILRLLVGEADDRWLADRIWILETNLDDVSGELVGHCVTQLMVHGALDVYSTAIQMKKNRPGVKLTVLCEAPRIAELEQILFRETTALGIRRWPAERHKLHRSPHSVNSPWGTIDGKVAVLADGTRRFAPEYESCRRVAQQHDVPLPSVYEAARQAFESSPPPIDGAEEPPDP
jgi:uncharacterized protein (TIGR00299 family) protein